MKKGLFSLAAAALLLVNAPTAGAQGFTINADYLGTRSVRTSDAPLTTRDGGSGGGFNFTTSDANPWNLENFVGYCFGADQFIQDPNAYRVLTFQEFVNWATRPGTYAQITFNDLNAMAFRVTQYTTGTSAPQLLANGTLQEEIWQIAQDNVSGGNVPLDFSQSYGVMIDEDLFTGKVRFGSAGQPLLVEIPGGRIVPEPASFALVGAGLLSLGFARRRRNRVS